MMRPILSVALRGMLVGGILIGAPVTLAQSSDARNTAARDGNARQSDTRDANVRDTRRTAPRAVDRSPDQTTGRPANGRVVAPGEQITPRDALNARISRVDWQGTQLYDAFEWLRETLNTNMHVDWGALKEVGVDQTKPIDIDLRWVSVPRLLRLMLQETGQGELLTFYVSGN